MGARGVLHEHSAVHGDGDLPGLYGHGHVHAHGRLKLVESVCGSMQSAWTMRAPGAGCFLREVEKP